MKKIKLAATIFLVIFLTFIFIIIKDKSISKINLDLLVSYSSSLVLEEYKNDISKAFGTNDEKLIYYIQNIKYKEYGENFNKLESITESKLKSKWFIVYENKYFHSLLAASFFLFWIVFVMYLYRK
jgi:hypothetical protein